MALTAGEKAQAIRVLGYSNKTLDTGSTHYSKILADRLTSLSADAEAQTRVLLVRISTIDTKLDQALDRLSAKRVDSIETNPDEIPMLKGERARTIRELGQTLDIPVVGRGGLNLSVVV